MASRLDTGSKSKQDAPSPFGLSFASVPFSKLVLIGSLPAWTRGFTENKLTNHFFPASELLGGKRIKIGHIIHGWISPSVPGVLLIPLPPLVESVAVHRPGAVLSASQTSLLALHIGVSPAHAGMDLHLLATLVPGSGGEGGEQGRPGQVGVVGMAAISSTDQWIPSPSLQRVIYRVIKRLDKKYKSNRFNYIDWIL